MNTQAEGDSLRPHLETIKFSQRSLTNCPQILSH